MKIHYIIIAAVLLLAGCKQKAPEQAAPQDEQPQVVFGGFVDTVHLEVVPIEKGESYFDKKAKTGTKKTATQAQPAATPQQPATKRTGNNAKAASETIYVEAEGARGRVWGHVTLKGDRGTGTVHDEGENTWAVSVTRHGDELYAIDQNSRQYVFKLKNK